MGDLYICRSQKKLRWGYTTGTCAAVASLAVAVMLSQGGGTEQISLTAPGGICLGPEAEEVDPGENSASCGVREDAGNDSDVADELMAYSQIWLSDVDSGDADRIGGSHVHEEDGLRLYLLEGVGVRRVTQCGLSCEVRRATINPVPRKMILEQVVSACWESGFRGVLSIEVHVSGMLKVTHRIFNSHLGIRGGIPILGTSGIVEPMSRIVLLDTIRLGLRRRIRKGEKNPLVTPGNHGESFVGDVLGLDPGQAVKCNNFVGSTIDMTMEEEAKSILLTDHGGKLIKLTAGIMNIHSFWVDGGMEILAAHGATCDAERESVEQTLGAVIVDEGLRLLETKNGPYGQAMKQVMGRLKQHVKWWAGEGLRAEAIVFINERRVLGATIGADDLSTYLMNRMRNK